MKNFSLPLQSHGKSAFSCSTQKWDIFYWKKGIYKTTYLQLAILKNTCCKYYFYKIFFFFFISKYWKKCLWCLVHFLFLFSEQWGLQKCTYSKIEFTLILSILFLENIIRPRYFIVKLRMNDFIKLKKILTFLWVLFWELLNVQNMAEKAYCLKKIYWKEELIFSQTFGKNSFVYTKRAEII